MQPGVQLAIAMWAMSSLCLTLVGLRLYTRIRLVRFVGAEDYLFTAAGVFFVVFTAAIQVAVGAGLGRSFWSLSLARSSRAIFWTYVANTFAIVGNAAAKLSLGLFLLRVVQLRWHRAALWVLVVVTAGTSAALAVLLWNQTDPVRTSWDPFRTPGVWRVSIQPLSVGLGVWSSAVDFFFAAFPWLVIWSLRMPRRERILLASSMSLGILAGVCGIIRTVVLARLNVLNYTLTFVTYFAWAAAEIAVSMVCIGIPTLRPLYLSHRGFPIHSTHPRHSEHGVLPQFTMCEPAPRQMQTDQPATEPDPETAVTAAERKQISPETTIASTSDTAAECTLYPSRESFTIDRPVKTWQPPPSLSGCSAASYVSSSADSSLDTKSHSPCSKDNELKDSMQTMPSRPHRTYARPYTAMGRTKDSVDEILGLYGQNSGAGQGQIWVKNEVSVQKTTAPNWPFPM